MNVCGTGRCRGLVEAEDDTSRKIGCDRDTDAGAHGLPDRSESFSSSVLPFHPCMDHRAHEVIPRLHLPVALRCNAQCGYCQRSIDEANDSVNLPGVSRRVLSPREALRKTDRFIERWGLNSVVGVAGPGDPLANEETFEAFRLVRKRYREAQLCLCTNGLNLPGYVGQLAELEVAFLSVTVNGLDPCVVGEIQTGIRQNGHRLTGVEAARVLIKNQMTGIAAAVDAGMQVKVNTVVIPEINGPHVETIALKCKDLGVRVLNLMPLIPRGLFSGISRPSEDYMNWLRAECRGHLPVFEKCKQCRADAEGIPGKETDNG